MSKRISRILSLSLALVLLITPMVVLADDELQTVHGTVFSDVDELGVFNSGELGIEGVLVTLLDADGDSSLESIMTAADGTYEFSDLALQDYTVEVEVLVGYADTTPISVLVTADGPSLFLVVNFGKQPLPDGSVSGTVCNDVDRYRDCVLEGVDIALEGVTVSLFDAEDELITTDVTDSLGKYNFPDLYPGSYTVVETDPIDITDPANPIIYYSTTPNTVVVILPTADSMDVVVDFGDFIPDESELKKLNLLIMKFFDLPLLDILDLRAMEGWGYGNIAKAYFLAQLSGDSVDGIIAMRDGMGWGNIMKDILGRAGLKGYNLGLIVSGREEPQTTEKLIKGCELIESEEQIQELFGLGGNNGSIRKACKLAQEAKGDFDMLIRALGLLEDYNQKTVLEMLQNEATIQVNNANGGNNDDNGEHGPPACKGKNKNDDGCSKK